MAGLSVGRHTVQMVAEMEQDSLTLCSESIYFDILKRGSNAPFIGTKIIHPDGRFQRWLSALCSARLPRL